LLADVTVGGPFHVIADPGLADVIASGIYCAGTVLADIVDTTCN